MCSSDLGEFGDEVVEQCSTSTWIFINTGLTVMRPEKVGWDTHIRDTPACAGRLWERQKERKRER